MKDAVNDTIPDFGFIGNDKKFSNEAQHSKKSDDKMSEDKAQQRSTSERKARINKDYKKNNENNDPFISIPEKKIPKKDLKQKKSIEKISNNMSDEDLEMNLMGSIAAQYVPDCIFGDESGYNNDYPNTNFLFGQLE